MRYDAASRERGAVAAASVLAASAMASAADGTVLAPVLEVAKSLIGVARTAANLRRDILETIEYCVAVVRIVIEAGERASLTQPLREVLEQLRADVEGVGNVAERFVSPNRGRWRLLRNSRDQGTLDELRKNLNDKLKLAMRALAALAAGPSAPPAGQEARVRGEVPKIPRTYVRRAADDSVVQDLVDPERPASSCHCVWGMGGAGKSLLAASVVRDGRTLSSFKQGVFWITVGKAGTREQVAVLLEHLSMLFERTSRGRSYRWPSCFSGADDASHHLRRALGDRRCLVVLDDVWHGEVVDSFAATGFHLLVTTRKREVVRRGWSGTFTEVLGMEDREALELLRAASQATGPLPEHEARSVSSLAGSGVVQGIGDSRRADYPG